MASRVELIFEALNKTGPVINEVDAGLKGVGKSAKTTNELFSALGVTVGAGLAVIFAKMATDLYAVNKEFGQFNAQLVTLTGSQANADKVFAQLEAFATLTPYQLNEVVTAFAKLKARGLDPSEAALTSYGNTASGMSKSLDQMIEAVADATTGEFERLKEFGINARTEGDQIKFTFKGVSTVVEKEASAIEGYLRNLGDVEFAGGMQRQMEELGGKASNLGDTWDKLMRTIGDLGATEAMKGSLGGATTMLETINADLLIGVRLLAEEKLMLQQLFDEVAIRMDSGEGFKNWLTPEGREEVAAELEASRQMYQHSWDEIQRRYKNFKEEISEFVGPPAPAAPKGPTDAELKKQEQLAAAWDKTRAGLTLDIAKSGLADFDAKLLEITAHADALRKMPLADKKLIDAWEEDQKAAEAQKLADTWAKTSAGLTIDIEKSGLSAFDAKLLDITTHAEALRKMPLADLQLIDSWETDQKGIVTLKQEMDALDLSLETLSKDSADALQIFQGFALTLERTGGAQARITDGLKLYDAEAAHASAGTKKMAEEGSAAFKEMENAVQGWASSFSSQLNEIFWSADVTFKDILESFGKMLSQMVIQKQIVEPLLGAGLDFLGGLGSSTPASTPSTFSVNPGSFNLGTPKFHSGGLFVPKFHFGGLNADEGMAILKGGERVLTEEQNRTFDKLSDLLVGAGAARASGSGSAAGAEIHIHEAPGTKVSSERRQGPGGREIIDLIISTTQDAMGRGAFDTTLRQNFGVNRSGR